MTLAGIVCIVLGIALPIASRIMTSRRRKIRMLRGGPILVIIGILMLTGVIQPQG